MNLCLPALSNNASTGTNAGSSVAFSGSSKTSCSLGSSSSSSSYSCSMSRVSGSLGKMSKDSPNWRNTFTKFHALSVLVFLTLSLILNLLWISEMASVRTSNVWEPMSRLHVRTAHDLRQVLGSIQWRVMPRNDLLCAVQQSALVATQGASFTKLQCKKNYQGIKIRNICIFLKTKLAPRKKCYVSSAVTMSVKIFLLHANCSKMWYFFNFHTSKNVYIFPGCQCNIKCISFYLWDYVAKTNFFCQIHFEEIPSSSSACEYLPI